LLKETREEEHEEKMKVKSAVRDEEKEKKRKKKKTAQPKGKNRQRHQSRMSVQRVGFHSAARSISTTTGTTGTARKPGKRF
jgi:hypothetical protein